MYAAGIVHTCMLLVLYIHVCCWYCTYMYAGGIVHTCMLVVLFIHVCWWYCSYMYADGIVHTCMLMSAVCSSSSLFLCWSYCREQEIRLQKQKATKEYVEEFLKRQEEVRGAWGGGEGYGEEVRGAWGGGEGSMGRR